MRLFHCLLGCVILLHKGLCQAHFLARSSNVTSKSLHEALRNICAVPPPMVPLEDNPEAWFDWYCERLGLGMFDRRDLSKTYIRWCDIETGTTISKSYAICTPPNGLLRSQGD